MCLLNLHIYNCRKYMRSNIGREDSIADMVTSHVSTMVAYWDKDLVCRFANDAYSYWFGRTREEMIDKITLEELLGPILFEKNLPYISGALRGEPQTFEREIPLSASDKIGYTLANYFPNIVSGEVRGFFVHVADISPIKLLEKELRDSNEMIRTQNKRLLSFANIVTHNLKSYANNLGAILELFAKAGTEKEKVEMFDFLKDISNGFSATISNLEDIVRTQNRSALSFETVNLHDYIRRAIDSLRIEIKSANAVINNNVSPEITIVANAAYVDSIILNFLTNAIKYRHPDRPPVVNVGAHFKDLEIILTIADNGRGIDLAKNKNDLFGLYKTFHNHPDAEGIGLFLVRSQVEALGGHIEVESEVGKGTTFKVYFKA